MHGIHAIKMRLLSATTYITLLLLICLANGYAGVTDASPVEQQEKRSDSNPIHDLLVRPIFRSMSCLLWRANPSCSSYTSSPQLAFQGGEEDTSAASAVEHLDDDAQTDRYHKHGWVYLIRHGEKVKHSDKTGLSMRGVKRARCLRNVFGDQGDQIDYILAQDFKLDGRRRRPYDTVAPLAHALRIPLDHSCDREDTRCVVEKIERHANDRRQNVLVVWEHARLTNIAKGLGITGLRYPSKRYDVVFKIRNGKVHAIYSEECEGLDETWRHWRGKKKGKHGKGGHNGRLVDDESWAECVEEDPEGDES